MTNYGRGSGLLSRLLGQRIRCPGHARLLILVEGRHDVTFLSSISEILHREDRRLPDLRMLEQSGEVVFVPIGGGDVIAWANRLAPIGLPEVHILDRETMPASEIRLQAARIVNGRPNCRGFVTAKHALENYLHQQCVFEVRGIQAEFGDDDDVPELIAKMWHQKNESQPPWGELTHRSRKRCRERAKRWLNQDAVTRMTPKRLKERDPAGEVQHWLATMQQLGNF